MMTKKAMSTGKQLLVSTCLAIGVLLCIPAPFAAQKQDHIVRETTKQKAKAGVRQECYMGVDVCRGRALLGPVTGQQVETIVQLFQKHKFPVSPTRVSDGGIYLLEAPLGKSTVELFRAFDKILNDKSIRPFSISRDLLEPDLMGRIDPADSVKTIPPNGNWGLTKIRAGNVWPISEGDPNLVIAVLDAGIYGKHNALKGNLWKPPVNYLADFLNPAVECPKETSYGINFLWHKSFPDDWLCQPNDEFVSHGTFVSGIIGAKKSNLSDTRGVLQYVQILPIKIINDNGETCASRVIQGIDFAIKIKDLIKASGQKLRIINSSFIINVPPGGTSETKNLELEIARAAKNEILIVSAAGNKKPKGMDIGSCRVYPASFISPNVIGVAASVYASDPALETLRTDSNFGQKVVHLAAPGNKVNSTYGSITYPYYTFDRTSAATPFVSGAAALLMSVCPDLTNDQVKDSLLAGADKNSEFIADNVIAGRLDVFNALIKANEMYPKECPVKVGTRSFLDRNDYFSFGSDYFY